MGNLFLGGVKLLGIALMMAVITIPGLRWTTRQAFKDKYHNHGLELAKQLENKINDLEKSLK